MFDNTMKFANYFSVGDYHRYVFFQTIRRFNFRQKPTGSVLKYFHYENNYYFKTIH